LGIANGRRLWRLYRMLEVEETKEAEEEAGMEEEKEEMN
jgi:hypothetical protein